jgi:hypothetical protein
LLLPDCRHFDLTPSIKLEVREIALPFPFVLSVSSKTKIIVNAILEFVNLQETHKIKIKMGGANFRHLKNHIFPINILKIIFLQRYMCKKLDWIYNGFKKLINYGIAKILFKIYSK